MRKALEKLPADRFTGAQQFANALSNPTFRHGLPEGAAAAAAGGSRVKTYAGWGVAAAFAVSMAWSATRPEPPVVVERFSLALDEDRSPNAIAVSPDGSAFVFAYTSGGQTQLWLQRWDNLSATPIPGTEGGFTPAVSPDGAEVAFMAGRELKVAPLGGGVVRTLADSAFCCPRWGPDGYLYYSPTDRTIRRILATGGTSEQVTSRNAEGDGPHGDFQVLPDGDVAIFSVWGTPQRIEAMRLSTGERKVLAPGIKPYVTATGHLVFGSLEGQILAAPIDPEQMELTGAPVPLVEGMYVSPNQYPSFALSEDGGTLVYWTGAGGLAGQIQMVQVTRSGDATPIDPDWTITRGDVNTSWSLSPDGTRLALREQTEQTLDIWIKQLPDGPRSRLTFDDEQDYAPRWTPDGRTVTYVSGSDPTNLAVFSRAANGTGSAQLVVDPEASVAQIVWSPDGEWLVLRTTTGAGAVFGRDILGFRPGVDSVPQPLMVADFDETDPAISPDGRWIAYTSNETDRYEVYVRPFPNVDTDRWQISTDGGFAPRWAHSGRELFFVDGEGNMSVAAVDGSAGFRAGSPEALFEIPPDFEGSDGTVTVPYDVFLDDQSFVMARTYRPEGEEAVEPELVLVQNWLEELKARVPK